MPTVQKRLKVLQITRDLDLGGLQQVILYLCRYIDRSQFDISVLCLTHLGCFASDVEALGVPVTLLEQKPGGVDYLAFRKVAKLIREQQIDIVHTHNTQAFMDGTLAALLAGFKTIIHTDHARRFPDKMRYMVAERILSTFAYKVVGCSDHTTQQLIDFEKIPRRKIVTIPNGIDGSRFTQSIDRARKRQELGLERQGPVIGLVGRVTEQKGITFLLQAMPEILKAHPNATALIVGDGDLRQQLQEEATRLGLSDAVRFTGPRKDVPELLHLFDIYAMPSLWEGLPIILLEAMAAGCPIIATDVGGNSGAVRNEETGLLIQPGSASAVSTAVIRLLSDKAMQQRFSTNAKNLFEREFSAQRMTERYQQLYLRKN